MVFIIWRGPGIIAILIPAVIALFFEFSINSFMGVGYYKAHTFLAFLAVLISAGVVYFINKKLEAVPGRILIDPETNEKVVLRQEHSLFWIKLKYFPYILIVLGFFVLFK
jgi:hypothetical protein